MGLPIDTPNSENWGLVVARFGIANEKAFLARSPLPPVEVLSSIKTPHSIPCVSITPRLAIFQSAFLSTRAIWRAKVTESGSLLTYSIRTAPFLWLKILMISSSFSGGIFRQVTRVLSLSCSRRATSALSFASAAALFAEAIPASASADLAFEYSSFSSPDLFENPRAINATTAANTPSPAAQAERQSAHEDQNSRFSEVGMAWLWFFVACGSLVGIVRFGVTSFMFYSIRHRHIRSRK